MQALSSAPRFTGRVIHALLALAVFSFSGSAQAQGTGATDRTIKARDFMDTFGVTVHFGENNYRNTQAIADALNIIGFSRIRGTCLGASDVATWKDIAARSAGHFPAGLKANVLITSYLNAPDATLLSQEKTVPQIAPFIETIEGPNEIDNYDTGNGTHGPFALTDQTKNFAANYGAWAEALFAWKKTVPALSKAKLLAPTLAVSSQEKCASLPDVSSYVSSGNFHFYAGNGRQPSNFGGGNFNAIYGWYKKAVVPTKPVSLSEWGQTTAGKPGQGGCDSATQAKYVLNQMCDLTARHVYRAYLYQLMDDTSDGDPTGNGGSEQHFGIFDWQWHVKPAAQALANVKNLLADTTTNFQPKVPAYTVSGISNAGAAGSSLSVSKSSGSTFVVVWNEPQIWDQTANAPVTPPADPVTVRFGGRYTYKVYDPLLGISAISAGSGTSVTVNVTGSPLLIQLIP